MSLKKLPTLEKRTLTVNGLPVRYAEAGKGKPIVLLHGWGGQIASWGLVPAMLAEESRVIALDLPGFGETPVPERPWDPFDYAELVAGFLRQLGLESPTLVGHSHGGRVSIALAARHPDLIGKLVLVDSAGIVPRRTPSYYTRVYGFKAARTLFSLPVLSRWREPALRVLSGQAGSSDYQAAGNPILRGTLVKCVNTDLRRWLPEVKASTLLIWGSADDATPLSDGQLMEKLIPDAGLVVFEGCGHFAYLDRLDQFCRVVNHFVTH